MEQFAWIVGNGRRVWIFSVGAGLNTTYVLPVLGDNARLAKDVMSSTITCDLMAQSQVLHSFLLPSELWATVYVFVVRNNLLCDVSWLLSVQLMIIVETIHPQIWAKTFHKGIFNKKHGLSNKLIIFSVFPLRYRSQFWKTIVYSFPLSSFQSNWQVIK